MLHQKSAACSCAGWMVVTISGALHLGFAGEGPFGLRCGVSLHHAGLHQRYGQWTPDRMGLATRSIKRRPAGLGPSGILGKAAASTLDPFCRVRAGRAGGFFDGLNQWIR